MLRERSEILIMRSRVLRRRRYYESGAACCSRCYGHLIGHELRIDRVNLNHNAIYVSLLTVINNESNLFTLLE